jgi:hypothetical protein
MSTISAQWYLGGAQWYLLVMSHGVGGADRKETRA